jgi:hypothetical protein
MHDARGSLGRLSGHPAAWWIPRPPTWADLLALEPDLAIPEAAVALAEGAGDPAAAVIAASLDKGEWAPPNVLIPLLERTGALPIVQARVGPEGAELLAKLQAAL